MINKRLLIVATIFFYVSCGQKELGIDQISMRNGLAYQVNKDNPFTGKVIHKLENGQVLISGAYSNGKKDGKWSEFYQNGQIKLKEEFKDGHYDGIVENFMENGIMKSHETYKDNSLNGACEYFSDNGTLIKKATYLNDELHGEFKENYANGNPKIITTYQNNKVVLDYSSYFENGNKELEYSIHNGKYSGDYIEYNFDSTVRTHHLYSDTSKINKGTWKKYWINDSPTKESNNDYSIIKFDSKGSPSESVKFYYKNGRLKSEGYFSSIDPDIREGKHLWYYDNGNIKLEGDFINDRKEGIWQLSYKENNMAGNKICQKVEYKNGKMHGKFEWYNIMYLNISDKYDLAHLINYTYGRRLSGGMINSTGNGGRWWKVEGQLVDGKFDGEFKIWDRNWGPHSLPKNIYKKHTWANGKMIWNGEDRYGGEKYFKPDGTQI
ncbi:MAG: hypothetical protein WBA61_16520 [Aequorivita sp.]